MNRKGEIDVVAIVILSLMIIALFVAMQMGVGYLNKVTGKSSQAQKETAALDNPPSLEPSFAEKVEQIFRPQVVAKRIEQRRLEAERQKVMAKRDSIITEINNLVGDLNKATEGLDTAIDKYNETDSKAVEKEALSEQAGRLEAHNRVKIKYLEVIAKFVQTLPQNMGRGDQDELLKLQASCAAAHKHINESDHYVNKFISGEPDDAKMLNRAVDAHNMAISFLKKVHATYRLLAVRQVLEEL